MMIYIVTVESYIAILSQFQYVCLIIRESVTIGTIFASNSFSSLGTVVFLWRELPRKSSWPRQKWNYKASRRIVSMSRDDSSASKRRNGLKIANDEKPADSGRESRENSIRT